MMYLNDGVTRAELKKYGIKTFTKQGEYHVKKPNSDLYIRTNNEIVVQSRYKDCEVLDIVYKLVTAGLTHIE